MPRQPNSVSAPAFFAPESQDFLGLVGNELQIAVARDANLAYLAQQYRRAGVGHVRIALDWELIEPEPGREDWGYEDLRVDAIARSGLRTLGILGRTPRWASSCPDLGTESEPLYHLCLAADLADYRRYVQQTVRRYGPAGTGQIRDWEIRVEANAVHGHPEAFWVEDYAVEINAAFEVLREEDPEARIWAGEFAFGFRNLDRGLDWAQYLARHAHFDVYSIHHFNSAERVRDFTAQVRDLLDAEGLRDLPLAITAMNLFVPQPEDYTEAMQAANLRDLFVAAWEGGADSAMWFAGTQWPGPDDRKFGIFRYSPEAPDGVVPRLAFTTLGELGQKLPEPPPGAVPYGCLGVSSNPCVPVGSHASVVLYAYSTGLDTPWVQIREGSRVIDCSPANRASKRTIEVRRGASRTFTLHPARSCSGGSVITGPLARVTVTALP